MKSAVLTPAMTEIMEKMFEAVGDTYSPERIKEPLWYLEHEWTQEQQDEFQTWLEERMKDSKFFRQITSWSTNNKQLRSRIANELIFYCGWKLKRSDR